MSRPTAGCRQTTTMSELARLTLSEASRRIREGELSPPELLEALIAQIERVEPRVRAWETIDRAGAREAASEAEAEIAAGGPRGPLHGVPVGLKDIYYTAGMRTSMSSRVYANFVPDYDSAAVERLRQAGAVILGKTVTTEFATADPSTTRNPWDAGHTPGGSSSGSAVAVATGMVPVATGSQTAGSVNRPAAYNGVVGLKPTYGRVSRYGVFPVSWSLDTLGWMAREVRDVAIVLDALSGFDRRDAGSGRQPQTAATLALDLEDPGWTPRIGVLLGVFAHESSLEMKALVHEVTETLRLAGAEVDFFDLPDSFLGIHEAQVVIDYSECAMVHAETFAEQPDEYAPLVRSRIECGALIPASAYVQAQRLRRRLRADIEAALAVSHDVLLMPATPTPAPADLTTTGDPVFQAPWTACGLPLLNLPAGLDSSGLPVGVQLAGRGWDEETLLRAGRWVERTLQVELGEPPLAA